MWRANSKTWVTRDLIDWINEMFGSSVNKYLLEMNMTYCALLVIDNAPAHHSRLEDLN